MNPILLNQVAAVVSGELIAPFGYVPPFVAGVSTDSRKMEVDSLFVALKGEAMDGHAYLGQAASKGAVAAMVETMPAQIPVGLPLLRVPNTRVAMGKLAAHVRQQLRGKVIAVGGSNGKTGTKNLIESVLSSRLRGTISPKSFNNDIGVPLTIFPADPNQDYLVLEMGTNHHGEIRVLTNMATPDVAVITNCAAEHLEGLDDLDGVRLEEASIIEGLKPDGLLVVHGDDPELLRRVQAHAGLGLTFGLGQQNDLYASDVRCAPDGVRFKLNGARPIFIPLLGKHVAINSLAAIAVARYLGMSDEQIVAALAKARGPEMRLQLQKVRDITLLNDAYNANPASVKAALETLCSLPAEKRRVAILGDMRELGESTDQLHKEVGRFAATCAIDALICVGEKAGIIAEEASRAGYPSAQITHYADTQTASRDVPLRLAANDLVLLKASRYMRS